MSWQFVVFVQYYIVFAYYSILLVCLLWRHRKWDTMISIFGVWLWETSIKKCNVWWQHDHFCYCLHHSSRCKLSLEVLFDLPEGHFYLPEQYHDCWFLFKIPDVFIAFVAIVIIVIAIHSRLLKNTQRMKNDFSLHIFITN